MPLFNLGHATHDRVGAEDLGEQGEQIGLACLVAPAFLNYLSGHRSKERKREENEKDEAMCPRKSSPNWAVSPDRQPLIFTIHKHRELCSARQISQCRQHLSVCGLKDCSSPPQEVQILMAIYLGRFIENGTANIINTSFIVPFRVCHSYLTLPAQVYLEVIV